MNDRLCWTRYSNCGSGHWDRRGNPDPSIVNQVVTVNFSLTSNVAGAPPVTGNVTITVNDASGDTCTGSVAAGTCALTLTTLGSKTSLPTTVATTSFTNNSSGNRGGAIYVGGGS